jgi:multimeric flavodoxin WrbA
MVRILGFMGSPRLGGNTDRLLSALLSGAEAAGAFVEKVPLVARKITPCMECGGCDETGVCVVEDDMTPLYELIAGAEVVVVASPIFFYNITSRTQALVERSQAYWNRKYVLKKGPLGGRRRRGIFLSLGATKGKMLFDGVLRTMRYFFDAIDADFVGALLYRGIESKGAIGEHPTALSDAQALGRLLAEGADLSGMERLWRP